MHLCHHYITLPLHCTCVTITSSPGHPRALATDIPTLATTWHHGHQLIIIHTLKVNPFESYCLENCAWLRVFHDIVTVRHFPPIRAEIRAWLTNERPGRSCQLVMVKVIQLWLCHLDQSRLAAAVFWALQYCTVYCVLYRSVLYCCHRYSPTGSWLLQVASSAQLTQADFTKRQETVSFFRHIEWP